MNEKYNEMVEKLAMAMYSEITGEEPIEKELSVKTGDNNNGYWIEFQIWI